MGVRVRFFANFREIVGYQETTISVTSVRELLKKLLDRHEELGEKIFDDKEDFKLNDSVNVMVNGRKIGLLDGIDTELKDEDIIAIFPPVAGG